MRAKRGLKGEAEPGRTAVPRKPFISLFHWHVVLLSLHLLLKLHVHVVMPNKRWDFTAVLYVIIPKKICHAEARENKVQISQELRKHR